MKKKTSIIMPQGFQRLTIKDSQCWGQSCTYWEDVLTLTRKKISYKLLKRNPFDDRQFFFNNANALDEDGIIDPRTGKSFTKTKKGLYVVYRFSRVLKTKNQKSILLKIDDEINSLITSNFKNDEQVCDGMPLFITVTLEDGHKVTHEAFDFDEAIVPLLNLVKRLHRGVHMVYELEQLDE